MKDIFTSGEALAVLLRDEDGKKAVLDYLKAETEKVKPKVDWREVWRQESDARPHVLEYDAYTGVKDKKVLVLARMRVKYHEDMNTADAIAFLTPPGNSVWFDEDYWAGRHDPLLHEARAVASYTEAVLWGQSLWAKVVEIFETVTNAPSEVLS